MLSAGHGMAFVIMSTYVRKGTGKGKERRKTREGENKRGMEGNKGRWGEMWKNKGSVGIKGDKKREEKVNVLTVTNYIQAYYRT